MTNKLLLALILMSACGCVSQKKYDDDWSDNFHYTRDLSNQLYKQDKEISELKQRVTALEIALLTKNKNYIPMGMIYENKP